MRTRTALWPVVEHEEAFPFLGDAVFEHGRASARRYNGAAHFAFGYANGLGLCEIVIFAAQ